MSGFKFEKENTSHLRIQWLGEGVGYQAAWTLQTQLARDRASGKCRDILLLLEHANVYTAGRRSHPEHVLVDQKELLQLGVPLIETDRGGQVTYHGPGQLVGYPVLDLREYGIGPLQYVRLLEQVLIATLSGFGIVAHIEPGFTGVWVSSEKIAAIGIKVSKGVAFHGFSLNVDPDLKYYQYIVSCGIAECGTTSMARLLQQPISMEAVRKALVVHFIEIVGTLRKS